MTVLAALAAFAPTAAADEGIGKGWRILFDDTFMEEPTTDSVFNARLDGGAFRLGDVPTDAADDWMVIQLCNSDAEASTGVRMTLESTDSVFGQIRAVNNAGTAIVAPITNQTAAQTINSGACGTFFFAVNLTNSGSIGKHPMRFDLVWSRATPGADSLNDVAIEMYVSSVFDAVDAVPDSHILPRLTETAGPNGFFLGSQTYQTGTIALVNSLGSTIEDLSVTLNSLPTGWAASGGRTVAYDTTTANAGVADLMWRIDVTGAPAPGPQDVGFSASYKRSPNTATERTISETGLTTKTTLDFTPILLAELPTAVSISQGEFTTFNVRFKNAGNVAFKDLTVQPAADGPAGDYFFSGSARYENDDATRPGSITIPDLAVGATSENVQVTVSHGLLLPAGTHRLAFRWNAWWFDDGATVRDLVPAPVATGSMWMRSGGFMTDHDATPTTPEVGRLYSDNNFNGVSDAGDGILTTEWPGAFVDVTATDPSGPTVLATTPALATGDVTNIPLVVTLTNVEHFALLETEALLQVGPGTPFFAPGNKTATALRMNGAPFTLGAAPAAGGGGAASAVTFTVDLNAAWWQAGSVAPGSFDVGLLLSGTNADSGTRFTNAAVPFRLELVGFGPNVLPSVSANGPIQAGKEFTMTVKLTNTGDDVARNIEVTLTAPARGVALLDQFFAAHRNVSLRMGDFGASTYADMVLAEALAERALSSPGGRIVVLSVDRIAPGESKDVVFTLVADPNVIPGATYNEMVGVRFADSQAARTVTKGPYVFVLLAGGDVRAVVLSDPNADTGGLLSSPGPGAVMAAAVAAVAGVMVLRRRR